MSSLPSAKLFIEGRYRKLTRDLPQTIFYCPDCKGHPRRRRKCERCEGFGKLTRDSVQELVCYVLGAAVKTRKNKFHGSGREDIDVRMLGEGRPFVVEFKNPKCLDVDLAELEAEINSRNEGRLEVRGLHWSDKSRVVELKESKHAKEYGALVEVEGGATADDFSALPTGRVTLAQQTPQRVAHRRAEKVRERWVEVLGVEPTDDPALWTVRLLTEHGTYVKEAITGEGGSTEPSLSSLLGKPARCVELDVLDIRDEGGTPIVRRTAPTAFGDGIY